MSVPVPIAVVNTNVLVSALFPRPSISRQVLERLREADFTLAISPELLGELTDVLSRPALKRRISHEAIEMLLANIQEDAKIVVPTERPPVVAADPDDDALFACALAAGATCIVSGDRAVLAVKRFRAIRVLRPSAFLSALS